MGAFVGRTANRNGAGTMVDYRYLDGANYMPPDDVVKKLRAAP
jgi:branched-chain amino acid transport system substrate-binding protein